MKEIIFTLLLPLVLAQYPDPPPRNFRPFQYKITPSIQTGLQLQQQVSVPHTVYGPPPVPKTIESLDIRRPIKISIHTGNSFNQRQQQRVNVPRNSYGVPVLNEPMFVYSKPERNVVNSFRREPCNHNQNVNQFSTTDKLVNQRLPALEAENFKQEFINRPQITNQYIPVKHEPTFNGQPRLPTNNVDVRNPNTQTLNENNFEVPVVIGTNTQESFDDSLNQNEVNPTNIADIPSINLNQLPNDRIPNFNPNTQYVNNTSNMETPNVHYYLPSPVPSTSARPVIRRKPTTTTTTQPPIEEPEEEATEDDNNTRRPQVAIANAFAGLYYPQQPTKGLRILPASQTEQSAQPEGVAQLQYAYPQYSAAYQLQAVQAYPQHIQPYYSLNLPIASAWRK